MTPYYADEWLTVYAGDCRAVMAEMAAESVHCVVTSPPYWGLRDYGQAGQLGLEATPEEYVANIVAVFREVRRVLRADGTVWLNLGDSYASSPPGNTKTGVEKWSTSGLHGGVSPVYAATLDASVGKRRNTVAPGLKPKDLVGIPWRVAFALQADGWYLRSDIVWSKPNPMPESVTDRPTKSHEYVFLLAKSARYFFDADAVREPHSREWWNEAAGGPKVVAERKDGGDRQGSGDPAGRNIRSVWTVATQPYPGAHFATFPEALVEPCVKAGTSERGVCPECGAPWRRVVETTRSGRIERDGTTAVVTLRNDAAAHEGRVGEVTTRTLSWIPSCGHDREPVPAVCLDPFAGSGTTGRVAQRLGRRAVLIDLNPEYLAQAMKRNRDIPLGLPA